MDRVVEQEKKSICTRQGVSVEEESNRRERVIRESVWKRNREREGESGRERSFFAHH